MLQPTENEFEQLAAKGFNLIPVFEEVAADLETPVSAFLKIARGDYAFLLESVRGGEKWGRYTFLGSDPFLVMRSRKNRMDILRPGRGVEVRSVENSFEELRAEVKRFRAPELPNLPRFFGGAVGFLAYDIVRCFEKIPKTDKDDLGAPNFHLMFTDTVLWFDNVRQTLKIIANVPVEEFASTKMAYQSARIKIDETIERLKRPAVPPSLEGASSVAINDASITSNMTREGYMAMVSAAKEYIAAGDVIQVVPSQRFEAPLTAHPFNIYRSLRTINPSPYMFYLRLGEQTLVGASPEVMVRVEGREITLRPIAGTRRRGATEAEDRALERELLADPKERAEHVMLVDLGRNDVGRVAEIGTVKVLRQMEIERYSHVMHIVSEARGRVPAGTPPLEVVRAAFPAGTLSGAPKVRAMQIIRELEAAPRGIYGGAVGYVSKTGDLDFAIAIRTAICKDDRFVVTAGAGIVEASDPASEAEETRNKARGVLCAIETAGRTGG